MLAPSPSPSPSPSPAPADATTCCWTKLNKLNKTVIILCRVMYTLLIPYLIIRLGQTIYRQAAWKETWGVVTDQYQEQHLLLIRPWVTEYSFRVNNDTYTNSNHRGIDYHNIGDTLLILYDPSNPNKARAEETNRSLMQGLVFSLCWNVLYCCIIEFCLFSKRRRDAEEAEKAERRSQQNAAVDEEVPPTSLDS